MAAAIIINSDNAQSFVMPAPDFDLGFDDNSNAMLGHTSSSSYFMIYSTSGEFLFLSLAVGISVESLIAACLPDFLFVSLGLNEC